MYTYIFIGKIHPERVSFSVGLELPFILKHLNFGLDSETSLKFENSVITVRLQSNADHSKDKNCNLETLKNIVEENVRIAVDAYCFVKSYSYDLEITKVVCDDLKIDYTFGVQGEWNIQKDEQATNAEFTKILKLFDRPKRIFLKDVLADFRRSIKYPGMTASFCFRAIETIRKSYFEDQTNTDDDKRLKDGWQKLSGNFNLQKNDFAEIRKFALPNRHGEYPAITYQERERIMNFTRDIIDKLILKL